MIEKIKNWICPSRKLKKTVETRNKQLIEAAKKYSTCKEQLKQARTENMKLQIELELLKQPVADRE